MLRIMCVLAGTALLSACVVDEDEAPPATTNETPVAQQPPPQPVVRPPFDSVTGLRFLVDRSDRRLYVLRGRDTVRSADVAVGTSEHPTPTGEWDIYRVDWNPDWTPPPGEEWTEDKEYQPPGSPDNPMGRARLVFNPPYTIHGTKQRESLGKASSHGSIRVANDVVVELGRMLMMEAGAARPDSFFQNVAAQRGEMRQIELPRKVPIKVRE